MVFDGRCTELSDDAWRTRGNSACPSVLGFAPLLLSPVIPLSRASFRAGDAGDAGSAVCGPSGPSAPFVSLSCLLKQSSLHAQFYVGDEPGWTSGKRWTWMLKVVIKVLAFNRNKISWAASISLHCV